MPNHLFKGAEHLKSQAQAVVADRLNKLAHGRTADDLSRLWLRPFSLMDIGLSSLISIAVVLVWCIGDFHTFHHSDTIVHALASLYRWAVFGWELNLHGDLLALITMWIKRPYWNLLALSFLYAFAFLGGFAIWGSLLCRKTTLSESSLWASLLIPLVLSKTAIFATASSNMTFGVSLFFGGWFAYWALSQLHSKSLAQVGRYAFGLLALGFLAIYTFEGTAILLFVLSAALLMRGIQLRLNPKAARLSVPLSRSLPLAGLGGAALIYKILEAASPYHFQDYYSFRISNVAIALPMMLMNWAAQDLATLIPLMVPLLFLLYQPAYRHARNSWLVPFTVGTFGACVIFSTLVWVENNAYPGRYLTYLSYLLILQSMIFAVFLARTLIPLGARQRPGPSIARPTTDPPPSQSDVLLTPYRLCLLAIFVLSILLNALEWKAYSPASPLSRLENTLGRNTPMFVEAGCDVLVGNYWKIWPAVLAVNDYYYREQVIDPHTQALRMVTALAYRSLVTESLWRPMLTWADVKLCAFKGDDQWVQWALSTYAPDVSLQKIGEQDDLEVFTIPVAERFGDVEMQAGPSSPVRSLNFEFDRRVPGSGWGDLETWTDNASFQWMTAPVATFYAPLASDQDVDIQFRVLFALQPDILRSLTLRVNDQPIALKHAQEQGGAIVFQGTISKAILAKSPPSTRLAFQVNRTVSPVSLDINAKDTRHLGVAFDWLRIGPALPSIPLSPSPWAP